MLKLPAGGGGASGLLPRMGDIARRRQKARGLGGQWLRVSGRGRGNEGVPGARSWDVIRRSFSWKWDEACDFSKKQRTRIRSEAS